MAEFCNTCSKEYNPTPDIDVYAIHKELKKGYIQSVLCEGCKMCAVSKEEDGSLQVAYPHPEIKDEVIWKTYTPKPKLLIGLHQCFPIIRIHIN